ncbi:hypothetical protein, partial [Candidatus Darwinibacter acetoxidans]
AVKSRIHKNPCRTLRKSNAGSKAPVENEHRRRWPLRKYSAENTRKAGKAGSTRNTRTAKNAGKFGNTENTENTEKVGNTRNAVKAGKA